MSPYTELVIEGPFMLVKGFLLGFLATTRPDSKYFFHRKAGIRRETLKDFLKELFELENYVHLCLETDLVDSFKSAIEKFSETTMMKVKSEKKITSANFSFAYEFFNEQLAQKAKNLLSELPQNVKIVNYHPYEEKDATGSGVEGYAPLHEFTSRARGEVEGDFAGVIDLYLKIKRSDLSESIICGKVNLGLE